MRIAFDHNVFTTQRYGGVSRYIVELAKSFSGADSARVFGLFHINEYLEELAAEKRQGLRKISAFPPKTRRIINHLSDFLSAGKIEKWDADIFHESYYSRRALTLPKGVARVCTVHDMIHEIYPNLFAQNDQTTRIKKEVVDRSDHVICISENTKQDLIRFFGTPQSKISVVHHGSTALELPCEKTRSTFSAKRPFVLFVGQRSGYKNFRMLLEAFGHSKNLRESLDIVAFGGGALTPHESEFALKCGLQSSQLVQLAGDDSVLSALYQTARVFCYPSEYEGFGMPPLEAMSAGCPVVVCNASCLPEIVGDGAALFPESRPDRLAETLSEVASDGQDRVDLIARGKKREESYTWERCSQETLAAYRLARQAQARSKIASD